MIHGIWCNFKRNPFNNLQTIALQTDHFFRIIGHELHFSDTKILENLGTDTIVAKISLETELFIGLNRIEPLILKVIGFEFIDETNATSLLHEINQNATPLFFYHTEC